MDRNSQTNRAEDSINSPGNPRPAAGCKITGFPTDKACLIGRGKFAFRKNPNMFFDDPFVTFDEKENRSGEEQQARGDEAVPVNNGFDKDRQADDDDHNQDHNRYEVGIRAPHMSAGIFIQFPRVKLLKIFFGVFFHMTANVGDKG